MAKRSLEYCFHVLWVFAFIAWLFFTSKVMISEMVISSAFMWIFLIGGEVEALKNKK